jgi:hypothetical protein
MDQKEILLRQPDLLMRAATIAECQKFTPAIQVEVRSLLKQLLAECTTSASTGAVHE